jgi:hypothetical protein
VLGLTGLLELVKHVLLATTVLSLIALLIYYAVFPEEADP